MEDIRVRVWSEQNATSVHSFLLFSASGKLLVRTWRWWIRFLFWCNLLKDWTSYPQSLLSKLYRTFELKRKLLLWYLKVVWTRERWRRLYLLVLAGSQRKYWRPPRIRRSWWHLLTCSPLSIQRTICIITFSRLRSGSYRKVRELKSCSRKMTRMMESQWSKLMGCPPVVFSESLRSTSRLSADCLPTGAEILLWFKWTAASHEAIPKSMFSRACEHERRCMNDDLWISYWVEEGYLGKFGGIQVDVRKLGRGQDDVRF